MDAAGIRTSLRWPGLAVTLALVVAACAGDQAVIWDGQDGDGRGVASGVYVARLEAGELVRSQKLMLAK